VAFDPLPEAVDGEKSVGLQAIDRVDFLRLLLGGEPASIRLVPYPRVRVCKGLPQNRVAESPLAQGQVRKP
jgi:hypothetical protein